jgi:hypothetical protein
MHPNIYIVLYVRLKASGDDTMNGRDLLFFKNLLLNGKVTEINSLNILEQLR